MKRLREVRDRQHREQNRERCEHGTASTIRHLTLPRRSRSFITCENVKELGLDVFRSYGGTESRNCAIASRDCCGCSNQKQCPAGVSTTSLARGIRSARS